LQCGIDEQFGAAVIYGDIFKRDPTSFITSLSRPSGDTLVDNPPLSACLFYPAQNLCAGERNEQIENMRIQLPCILQIIWTRNNIKLFTMANAR
jgi:hypothetical protein